MIGYVVALRKESVDRNVLLTRIILQTPLSLSARRAWIEITVSLILPLSGALSLSARRAWIEILTAL